MNSPSRQTGRRRSSITSVLTSSVVLSNPSSPQPSPLSRRLSLGLSMTFPSSQSSSSTGTSCSERTSPTSSIKAPASPINTYMHSPTSDSAPRALSDFFSVFKRDKHAIWWGVAETEEIRRLDALLADREIRNEIVMDLLAAHSEYVLPLRFIASFADYRCTPDRKEKLMKGRKILSTFFHPTSAFHLKSIPEEDLSQVRVEHLAMVKTYLLSELLRVPLIVEHLAIKFPSSSSLELMDAPELTTSSSLTSLEEASSSS